MQRAVALFGGICGAAIVACSGFSSEEASFDADADAEVSGDSGDTGDAAQGAADASVEMDADLTRKRLFLTSETYDGAGAGGGDQSCINLAADAGLGGTWAAWLSKGLGAEKSAAGRMAWKGPWYDLTRKNIVIAAPDQDGGAFPAPTRPIAWTQTGDTLTTAHVWTGTTADGTTAAGSLCGTWSDNSATKFGVFGVLDIGPSWTRATGADPCSSSNHLYCFEQ